jgi:hypothetical protein
VTGWLIGLAVPLLVSAGSLQELGSIRGVVLDKDFGSAVAGAEVLVLELGLRAISDSCPRSRRVATP